MRASLSRSALVLTMALAAGIPTGQALASSHREAPLISYDPLADNTDLYAFRSPDNPDMITLIANYIPFELPEGGPNYYSFGEGVRYEIHVDNNTATAYDDIIYRFSFTKTNEDPSTFFNIRLGKQNLKTTYTAEKSTDGGQTFTAIVTNGVVPPPNIGPRSIEGSPVGLGTTYQTLMDNAIANATGSGGERIFCGPVDDPFFVDLGGIFDLGAIRDTNGVGPLRARDALAGFNCHTIAIQVPISSLQKDGKTPSASNILDGDFIIGVWACAMRPRITTLSAAGDKPTFSNDYVQVSRLGMPLTNEAIIPIGMKDKWNSSSPHDRTAEESFEQFFINPELALYMDDSKFGGAVPGFSKLRIQTNSLGLFDFRNNADGLNGLTEAQRNNTAFAASPAGFGAFLLRPNAPRSADILPIFYTGVPNLPPYQLATGKTAGPLSPGKPFVNNFMPTLGDMLRLNMAVPATPRNDPKFSSEGLFAAAVLGLTDPTYANTNVEFIPNMDGFPNGRRLEDDVTRIELQAVGGAALAAIGLWYDDYSGGSPVTQQLLNVLGFTAGPTQNDVALRATFPYMAMPHRGYDYAKKLTTSTVRGDDGESSLNIAAPVGFFTGQNAPNPTASSTSLGFHLSTGGPVRISVYSVDGKQVATILDQLLPSGDHKATWAPAANLPAGMYVATLTVDGRAVSSTKVNIVR